MSENHKQDQSAAPALGQQEALVAGPGDVVCVGDSKPLRLNALSFCIPVEYGYQWFESNRNKKPPLNISLSKDSSLETSRSWAAAFLEGTSVTTCAVTEYLYHVYSRIKGNLTEPWVSYGVTIGQLDITPLSLIDVTTTEAQRTITLADPHQTTSSWDIYLVTFIAASYRLRRTHKTYRNRFLNKVNVVLSGMRPTEMSAFAGQIVFSSLSENNEINILLSALDMFLNRFPQHYFARARVGTIILRYQGLAAISDLHYLKRLIGVEKIDDAAEWFMVEALAEEYRQLVKNEKEEFNNPYSYYPYMMGLNILAKSPYSAASNPSIHMMVHIYGSLMGQSRSINAVQLETMFLPTICTNSVLMYLATRSGIDLAPQFLNMSDLSPPLKAFMNFNQRGKYFTKPELDIVKASIAKIKATRTNTIGHWVKASLMTALPH